MHVITITKRTFRGGNSVEMFGPLSKKGFILRGKSFPPLRTMSFLSEEIPFQNGFDVPESKYNVTKLSPFRLCIINYGFMIS